MMKRKRVTALVLCAAVILSQLPAQMNGAAAASVTEIYVSADGSDSRGDGSEEMPYRSVAKAYGESPDEGRIIVSGTVVIDDYMDILKFSENKRIELTGRDGGCIVYDGDQNIDPRSAILKVTAGEVVIRDITLKMPDERGKNGRVLYVAENGTVTAGSGAVIENGYLAASSGNIYVGSGGHMILDGGVVRNGYLAITNADAYGAGVFVDEGGSFLMKSGEISGNTAKATVSNYRTYGGGAAVMKGGRFEMTGGTISGNAAETGGAGLYVAEGAEAVFCAGEPEGSGHLIIRKNCLVKPESENNLYFAKNAAAKLTGSMAGADIGVTCEDEYYGRIVFVPGGSNRISGTDEASFVYDDGSYDIRLDSFTENLGNLILWYWTVGVDIGGTGITSENTAEEVPAEHDYDTVLIPDEGYRLPEKIEVGIGGEVLDPEDYEWNRETGEIHIDGEYVTDDITVRADADRLYEITVSCSHVTADIASAAVTEKDITQIVFSPQRKYGLPEASGIEVTGECSFSYDPGSGILTVEKVKEDVTVRARGSEIAHTIFFDPDGGTMKPGEEEKRFYESDPVLGKLPVPEKEGYHFDGWFAPDGERITEDTPNDSEDDITLKAKWSAKTDIRYTIRHFVEKTDSGINSETDTTDRSVVSVKDGGDVTRSYYLYGIVEYEDGIADHVQTMNDRLMDCDRIKMEGLSIDGFVPAGFNVYEYEIEADGSTEIVWYYNRKDITVRYDGNGGTASESETKVKYGSDFGTLASAQREGYTFDGWYTDPRGGEAVTAEETCLSTQDLTLYAHWKAQGNTPYRVIHRTQNLENNTVEESHTSENTEILQTEVLYGTSDTTADLYAMAAEGFRPCPGNTYQIYIKADGTSSAVLYYDRLCTIVSYDANGGVHSADGDMKTKVWYGGVMGTVQAPPVRAGYTFTGWYTAESGGSEVSEKTDYAVVAPDGQEQVTVYAHWKKNPEPEPEPSPGTDGKDDGGGGSGGTSLPALTKDHISYLRGYPDVTFQADQNMTRAETAQMFFNLLEKPVKGSSSFSDVSVSDWFAEAVGALADLKIIEGYPDGTFDPQRAVSRAEFVMMASRFFKMEPAEPADFSDVGENSWYAGVVASAAAAGWITGYPDGTFRPENPVSRGEVTVMTNRVLQRTADKSYIKESGNKIMNFIDLDESHWAYYDIVEAVNSHDYRMKEENEVWTGLLSV